MPGTVCLGPFQLSTTRVKLGDNVRPNSNVSFALGIPALPECILLYRRIGECIIKSIFVNGNKGIINTTNISDNRLYKVCLHNYIKEPISVHTILPLTYNSGDIINFEFTPISKLILGQVDTSVIRYWIIYWSI